MAFIRQRREGRGKAQRVPGLYIKIRIRLSPIHIDSMAFTKLISFQINVYECVCASRSLNIERTYD
jgi:hypothetical protein